MFVSKKVTFIPTHNVPVTYWILIDYKVTGEEYKNTRCILKSNENKY